MGKAKYLIDETGKKTAVVLPLKEYEELIEDIHDLSIIAERKNEPVVGFNEVRERLKTDGLL